MSNRNEGREEYGRTVVRDIFLVICILIATSGIWAALWDIFKKDPSEGFKAVGTIIVTFFKVSWEYWAALGTIGVFCFIGYIVFWKTAQITDRFFESIIHSPILSIIAKLGLVCLVGGWLYFVFS